MDLQGCVKKPKMPLKTNSNNFQDYKNTVCKWLQNKILKTLGMQRKYIMASHNWQIDDCP